MTQIIDELAVTLRDLEIERLKTATASLIGEIEALRKKVGNLKTKKQAYQARCTKLRQKLDKADELADEKLAQNAEMLLLVKSFHETTGQTEDFRQFCREAILSRDDQVGQFSVLNAAAELAWQRRLADA
tara:strand:- start:218 stop:607 length:390 start_codon:yes stop_codon:yes gene_type:complete